MSIISEFVNAVALIFTPYNLFLIILGTLLGLFMGALPGLGGIIALALVIPLTFSMDPLVAFMLLAAIHGGTNFGGSITAILINTPGGAPNAATLLDGYPMTRKGEGGRAISASAVASAGGAIVGVIVLIASIPLLRQISLLFGPAEVALLGVWGLTMLAIIVRGSVIAGLISGGLGLMFAMHGLNIMTTNHRWTYGATWMFDGFKLIPALIGLFAIAEMMNLASKGESIIQTDDNIDVSEGRLQGIKDVFIHRWLFLRSSIIGVLVGTIPGIGGSAANFIAYFQASQSSADSEKFGTGDVRGVIASEASNDGKDGGALIPTLGLGIPGSASMAVLFGAFILHGVQPGPFLFREHTDIIAVIIVSLLIANLLTSAIGLILVKQLVWVTKIDAAILAPIILGISYFGAYGVNGVIYDLYIALIFGIMGFVMIRIEMSRVPMILGMVLGPIVERNYFRALQIGSDHTIFINTTLAISLLVLIVLSLAIPFIKPWLKRKSGAT